MLDQLIILLVIAYLVSPIVLGILLGLRIARAKRAERFAQKLCREGRVQPEELTAAKIPLPPPAPAPMQPAPVPVPVPERQPEPPRTDLPLTDDEARAISAAQQMRTAQTEAAAAQPAVLEFIPPETASVPAFSLSDTPAVLPELRRPEQPVRPAQPKSPEKPREYRISAITVMLSVGVILIILAGMLFVRSKWSDMSDFGRLGILAAGSAVFFGASALARRIWKLDRTAMAFFTIGAVFLPLSIWAAGYFRLLGENLAGAANKWTITFAFAAFTVIAAIAVKLYKMTGWGVGMLCGLTGTLLYLTAALVQNGIREILLIAAGVLALVYTLCARPLKTHLPAPLSKAAEPFALGYALFAGVMMLAGIRTKQYEMLCGAAAFLTAAAFLAPVVSDRLKAWTALPMTAEMTLGFAMMFRPLTVYSGLMEPFSDAAYIALVLLAAACALLLLILTDSLPELTKKGFSRALFIVTGIAAIAQLSTDRQMRIPVAALALILLILLMIPAIRTDSRPMRVLAAVQGSLLAFDAGALAVSFDVSDASAYLLVSGISMLLFFAFAAVKKMRTDASDLFFSGLTAGAAMLALDQRSLQLWQVITAVSLVLIACVLFYFLAVSREPAHFVQYVFAVMLPASLLLTTGAASGLNRSFHDFIYWHEEMLSVIWAGCSLLTALAAALPKKEQKSSVRRLLFVLCAVPPFLLTLIAGEQYESDWNYILMLGTICFAVLFWQLFAKRGKRVRSAISFGAAEVLTVLVTCTAASQFVFQNSASYAEQFPVLMTGSVWVMLTCAAGMFIRRGMLTFNGSDVIVPVMRILAPLMSLLMSCTLMDIDKPYWDALYFLTSAAMAVLVWLLTEPHHILVPAASVLSGIITLEALRIHVDLPGEGYAFLCIGAVTVLTVLLPYLGIVSREDIDDPVQKRRSYVLTAAGGIMPLWLAAAAAGLNGITYSECQSAWMWFFVPVLIAGYILHFAYFMKNPAVRKHLITASAAFFMIALWIQPVFHVSGSYFEGKLHLIPLLAFGFLLRHLYGKETGSLFLFLTGIYAMLRLAGSAMARETTPELLTVLIVALVMFIASFYIKEKKWFLLGGISLCGIAVYLRMKLFPQLHWWVFLLAAGIILILIAAKNETMKQRGESLKEKAGRFWEDWKW